MAKFKTGFLLGALIGTGYALLTTKKSGPERQADAAAYVDTLSQATTGVQTSVKHLGTALTALRQEIATTLTPTVADIQASVDDFQFQAQPHIDAINDSLDRVNQAAETLVKSDD